MEVMDSQLYIGGFTLKPYSVCPILEKGARARTHIHARTYAYTHTNTKNKSQKDAPTYSTAVLMCYIQINHASTPTIMYMKWI